MRITIGLLLVLAFATLAAHAEKAGSLVYVRYWRKAWSPPKSKPDMPPPTGCAGHWDLPKEGEMLRVYVDNLSPETIGVEHDGGYNVLLPNGFERLTAGG